MGEGQSFPWEICNGYEFKDDVFEEREIGIIMSWDLWRNRARVGLSLQLIFLSCFVSLH